MEYSCVQLTDLPDEILLNIFKKVDNVSLLYSLYGVDKRLNQILNDPIFTSHLDLLTRWSDDDINVLPNSILERFLLQILPEIHDKVKWLNLESSSMGRFLLWNDYPNLNGLGFYNLERVKAENLFSDETLLFHKFKNKILSLVIHMNKNDNRNVTTEVHTFIFTHIFTMFTNLQCLNYYHRVSFHYSPPTIFSSNLLELHVYLDNFTDCLYLLDGRFNELRTLHVNISTITLGLKIDNKQNLRNLRCFVLYSDLVLNAYNGIIVPLLHRMSGLEELTLSFENMGYRFIDGNDLNDIINHMTQLKKFTFNIHSSISLHNQIDFRSNVNILNTFQNFQYSQVISCVDYFSKAAVGQCHIYSHPYTLKYYNNITNNFPGGIFECVREISLFDERPFEHEFFLRIAQSFPLIKELTLTNQKPQCRKFKDDRQDFSIIKYPHLTYLNLNDTHEDYIEQFLDDTRTSLPYNMDFITDHQLLEKITDAVKKSDTITRIKNARQRVRYEIQDLTERLRVTQENIKRVRQRTMDTNSSIGTLAYENIKREIVD